MAHDVHLSVVFSCSRNDGVAEMARKFLPTINADERQEAAWFLEDLSKRSGHNRGPKGGLSTWGIVGNYVRADEFVDALKPFFTELLTASLDGGPLDFEHVLVFFEHEQSEQAQAYELYLEESPDPHRPGGLVVKHHMLPFTWMQY